MPLSPAECCTRKVTQNPIMMVQKLHLPIRSPSIRPLNFGNQ